MTFSICAREEYETDGEQHQRFGVAVTTRRPTIGSRCPYVTSECAIATQAITNPRIGRKGLEYVEDGLNLEDAMTALLNADTNSSNRQVHAITDEETFAFSGDDCPAWYGHEEYDNYTVAGNTLVGEGVLDAVASEFEGADSTDPLAERLIRSLNAGQEKGGDKRTEREIQSAAVRVRTTEERPFPALHNDVRADATETPLQNLLTTYRKARRGARE